MAGGSVCKSCGSLLPLPDSEGHVSCMSCGRAERAAEKEPTPAPGATAGASAGNVFVPWTPDGTGGGVSSKRSGRTGRGIGCIVGLAVVIAAIPIAIAVGSFAGTNGVTDAFDDVKSSVGPRRSLGPSGYEVLELRPDGGGVEVVTVAYDGQKNTRFLTRAAVGADPDDGWESEPFPSGVNDARMVLAGQTIFAVVGDELWSVVAETGAVSWKAPLSDVVHPSCEGCFQPLGDGIVVETADGQVFAYGPGGAEPRWGHRLVATNSPLAVSGAGVAVVDDVPDGPGRKHVLVLDPATGAVVSTHAPQCENGFGGPRTLNFTDHVYAIPDSVHLLATISTGGTCAVRWNGSNGQLVWSSPVGEGSMGRKRGLVTPDRLYLESPTGIESIDLASGAVAQWAAPADTTVSPLFRSGDLLVVESASTRGTAQAGLAAFDVATGGSRWHFDLPGERELLSAGSRTSDALFDEDGRSVVFEADGRLVVATFSGESRAVTTRTVDLASGVLSEAASVQLPSRPGTPSVTVHSVGAGGLLFGIDQKIVHLPLGGEPALWPTE